MAICIAWTPLADATLVTMRAQGFTWPAVAARLSVGRNAAIERGRRLGLRPLTACRPAPKPAPERTDRAPLPPGHPLTWSAITANSPLEGTPYPYPVYL